MTNFPIRNPNPEEASMPSSTFSYPATAQQEGLWLLHQASAGRYLYNCPFAFRVRGALDCDALAAAFRALVARHDSLRTVFASRPDGLSQIVHETLPPAIRVVDLSARDATVAANELERLAEAVSFEPFDLEHGPLVRMTVAKTAPDDYALMFALHHTVFDEWSTDVLIQEMNALYGILMRGGDVGELSAPRMQFPEYAAWLGRPEAAPEIRRQLEHWRGSLADAAAPVMLPTDTRPVTARDDYRGAREHCMLDARAREAMDELAQRLHAPPAAILIATFAAILGRYAHERDIALGFLVSGRQLADSESMIGLLVNSLVLRIRLGEEPSFEDLVRQTRDRLFDAYTNQDVPFQQVVSELNPARSADSHPLFRCCVNYHPGARASLAFAGLSSEPLDICPVIAQFELLLDAWPTDDGRLACCFEYRAGMFDRDAIRRFVARFRTLLGAFVAEPAARVSGAPLVDASERAQLLRDWNATGRDFDLEAGFAASFDAIASVYPDKTALVFGDQQLSYAELDRLTNDVAAYLRAQGVGPEMRVGLCVEASFDMIVGMFGILKAGAAYVALDPEDPPMRRDYLIDHARLSFVLAQSRFLCRVSGSGLPCAALDRDVAGFAAAGRPHAAPGGHAGQLAYLMYTSGSTGHPKAVAIAWASVSNHVHSFREISGLRADDRCMLFSSFAFDGSVEEIFAPLLTGATLVIHPERPVPIDTLERLIVSHQLTFLDFTAGYWNVWLDLLVARNRQIPAPVRQVVIGGELIRANQLISWDRVNRDGEVSLLITYGPTEATVIAAGVQYGSATSPVRLAHRDGYLGRPLGNLSAYVLDDDLALLPAGAVGELYIAGANLARGYFDAPAATAERFVPNPHATTPGQRLYRTGDLAMWLPDGTLLHRGRADNQIKFRGFRIELGEIERCLAQFPHAQAAVAAVAVAPNGDPTLAVFVMAEHGHELQVEALRQFLAAKLPAYLVPQRIEISGTFPVKPSGKTDVAKLVEAIDWAKGDAADRPRASESGIVGEITGMFSTLLKRGELAPGENFFKAGGHSLLALQVLSRIRQAHGVQVSIKDFYQQPTAEGLAQVVDRLKQSTAAGNRPRLSPLTRAQRT
ncbi:hypothetical protein BZL54_22095 [Burkholderia ubonensis subsp. mesacidophila]|uniref:Carrier domain-containing protein n=2 Tax=Burkholderia ubonensis TaxID=101571 RepID=A0A2A4FCJ5_9BURK|nr:hypothetical protein BZL54_22095 [Burkholderia ubonensis subsp. mesacidophila]